jgi:hypothetical protein
MTKPLLFERLRESAPHLSVGRLTTDSLELGPDIVIAGSAVFEGKNSAANAACMLQATRSAARGRQPLLTASS